MEHSRYGTDSNTEEEIVPTTTKKPRVGRWPSATRERSQAMITHQRLNQSTPSNVTTKLIGTATSPRPIVKTEDSKYDIVIKTELPKEKKFHNKPVPKAKRAVTEQTTMQKNGSNYLLDNWNTADEPTENLVSPTKLIHPSSRACSKTLNNPTK